MFRRDRQTANSTCLDGGGVLTAVPKWQKYRVNSGKTSNEDQVNAILAAKTIAKCGFYLPPTLNMRDWEFHTKCRKKYCIKVKADVHRDFNLPVIKWDKEDDSGNILIPSDLNTISTLINDFISVSRLKLYNSNASNASITSTDTGVEN